MWPVLFLLSLALCEALPQLKQLDGVAARPISDTESDHSDTDEESGRSGTDEESGSEEKEGLPALLHSLKGTGKLGERANCSAYRV
jgi:hypothetical protein